jgi:hypothetical protein
MNLIRLDDLKLSSFSSRSVEIFEDLTRFFEIEVDAPNFTVCAS